jgi:hypothetical protein
MSTRKRQIAFYADPDIADWYEMVPQGAATRQINQLLRAAINDSTSDAWKDKVDHRLNVLEAKAGIK